MKDKSSANKLADEMQILTDAIRQNKHQNEVLLKTGDVLGALEVFTFANFNDPEQEVIFSRARRGIETFTADRIDDEREHE